jgi:microtubule-associated protein-like 6
MCITLTSGNVETGSRLDGSTVADAEVPQWTSMLGWPVQGIWYAGSDGTDINAVHIPPSKCGVVTADDEACVRLYRYPCLSNKSEGRVYRGHASHVLGVKFTCDEQFVISVGGEDMATLQWKLV